MPKDKNLAVLQAGNLMWALSVGRDSANMTALNRLGGRTLAVVANNTVADLAAIKMDLLNLRETMIWAEHAEDRIVATALDGVVALLYGAGIAE